MAKAKTETETETPAERSADAPARTRSAAQVKTAETLAKIASELDGIDEPWARMAKGRIKLTAHKIARAGQSSAPHGSSERPKSVRRSKRARQGARLGSAPSKPARTT